jgi:hypothetical protein
LVHHNWLPIKHRWDRSIPHCCKHDDNIWHRSHFVNDRPFIVALKCCRVCRNKSQIDWHSIDGSISIIKCRNRGAINIISRKLSHFINLHPFSDNVSNSGIATNDDDNNDEGEGDDNGASDDAPAATVATAGMIFVLISFGAMIDDEDGYTVVTLAGSDFAIRMELTSELTTGGPLPKSTMRKVRTIENGNDMLDTCRAVWIGNVRRLMSKWILASGWTSNGCHLWHNLSQLLRRSSSVNNEKIWIHVESFMFVINNLDFGVVTSHGYGWCHSRAVCLVRAISNQSVRRTPQMLLHEMERQKLESKKKGTPDKISRSTTKKDNSTKHKNRSTNAKRQE